MKETKAKSSQFGDMDLESTQTNFIQKLLKECRQKVIVAFQICFKGVMFALPGLHMYSVKMF